MANINLISARRAERVRLTKIARGLFTGLIVSGVLSAGSVTFMLTRMVMASARAAHAEAKLVELRPVLEEIENAERERAELVPKLETLTQAQVRTNRWFGIMDGLRRVIPPQTWLTSLAVQKSGEANLVKINGITVNQSRVGETMYRLTQQTEFYTKVDLGYTRTTTTADSENVEFELAAALYQPELEKKEENGDANKTK